MADALAPARMRISPAIVWAGIGLAFLLLQLYVYSSWVLSENFRATPVGPDPIPDHSRIAMRVYEILSLITLAIVIPWFIQGIRKTRRVDSTRLMMIGWLSAYWLDPFLSFLRPMFTYNAYAFNRGCWCEFIPFWQTPNGARIAEPLLIDGPAYFFSFASTAVIALWCMKTAKSRWPVIGPWGMGLAGFVGVWISMGLLDIGMTRLFYFDAWGGSFQAASFWGGEFYQFPIYEFVLFPSTFVACAFLLYYADASGQTAIERGIEQISARPRLQTVARVLIFIAFCNVLNLAYTGAMGVHALYVDDWPATMPSWLANEQCGPSTGVICPPGID
jgi:hypothetical protein